MKLTRKEFTHAQDKQLATLGICRAKNAGWLKPALLRDFTAEQVQMFHSERRKPKVKTEAKIARDPKINFGRPHIAGVGTMAICDRFIAGENVADMAADYGMQRKHIEDAIRFELSRLVKAEDAREEAELGGEIPVNLHLPSLKKWAPTVAPIDGPEEESPEAFANQLFESSGRDLDNKSMDANFRDSIRCGD